MNKHLLNLPDNKIKCGLTSGDGHFSSGEALYLYEEFDVMSYTETKRLRKCRNELEPTECRYHKQERKP